MGLRLGLLLAGLLALVACSAEDDGGGRTRSPVSGAPAGSVANTASGTSAVPTTAGSSGAPVMMPGPGVFVMPGAGTGAAGRGGNAGTGAPLGAAGSGQAGRGTPPGSTGMTGTAGRSGAAGVGAIPMSGAGGTGAAASGEAGRMAGMTAAHNVVRAMVQSSPPLPPLTWNPTIAAYAQEWADSLAKNNCNAPMHRSGQQLQQKGYGENLAAAAGKPPPNTNAQWATDGWAGEVQCWTPGTIEGTEKCDQACYRMMNSDGCGHYTQIVWRKSTELGCGVASCESNGLTHDIWICNYAPAGNFIGQAPY